MSKVHILSDDWNHRDKTGWRFGFKMLPLLSASLSKVQPSLSPHSLICCFCLSSNNLQVKLFSSSFLPACNCATLIFTTTEFNTVLFKWSKLHFYETNLGARPKDKCKTVLPQRAEFMDSISTQTFGGQHKHTPQSTPTLQLENRFEPLVNLNKTEVEMTTDKFRYGSIMKSASRQKTAEKGKYLKRRFNL